MRACVCRHRPFAYLPPSPLPLLLLLLHESSLDTAAPLDPSDDDNFTRVHVLNGHYLGLVVYSSAFRIGIVYLCVPHIRVPNSVKFFSLPPRLLRPRYRCRTHIFWSISQTHHQSEWWTTGRSAGHSVGCVHVTFQNLNCKISNRLN